MSSPAALASFEAVYRQHFALAWRALRRLGVPERDLADATQDVFLVVYRKLGDCDLEASLNSWVYAICLRVASDRRRNAAHRHEQLTEVGEHAEPSEPRTSDEGERLRHAERRALLEAALDAMSLEQRAVFTLFELEGHTGDEVASLLGIPVATAHSRLRLARGIFRRIVQRGRASERFAVRRVGGER